MSELVAQLEQLSRQAASGRLDVRSGDKSGQVWLSGGRMAMIVAPDPRPALGMRLVSGGILTLAQLGRALAAQATHPQLRLGDILVRLHMASRQDVEAFAWEQMCDQFAELRQWPDPTVTFTPLPREQCPAPGPAVPDLLRASTVREQHWSDVVRRVGGADTVPSLTEEILDAADVALRPTDWAVLCRVDGRRSLHTIARDAGFTEFEAASVLAGLVAAGLVAVPEFEPPTTPEMPAAQSVDTGTAAEQPDEAIDPVELMRELSQLAGGDKGTKRWGRG